MEQYLLLKCLHCAGTKMVNNGIEKQVQPYRCQKLEHDGQVIDWVLMPKASQIYSHRCCESVFDPDGVVEVCCLLFSINLVSLRDMKTIGKALEPNSQVVDWVLMCLKR